MRFKLSIGRTLVTAGFLGLAAVLSTAGTLHAQDSGPKIVGDAAAAFGTYSRDDGTDSLSGYHSAIESNVRFRGGDETMDYELRLRARGHETGGILDDKNTFDDGQFQTIRLKVGWNVSPAFRIEMGKTGGIDPEYSDTEVLETPGALDANLGNFNSEDDGSIVFLFKAGEHKVGLVLVSDCQVGCEAGNGSTQVYGKNMVMPYYYGTFGPVEVHARVAQNSAKTTEVAADGYGGTTLTAQATAIGVGFEGNGFTLGFDLETQDIACDDEADPDCDNTKVQAWGIGGTFSGIYATYSADTTDFGGDENATHTFYRLGYEIKVGKGSVYPEIASAVSNDGAAKGATKPDDVVESYVRLAMKTKF